MSCDEESFFLRDHQSFLILKEPMKTDMRRVISILLSNRTVPWMQRDMQLAWFCNLAAKYLYFPQVVWLKFQSDLCGNLGRSGSKYLIPLQFLCFKHK